MITDAKISSAAKISPAKIAPALVGQLMVAQADGKYAPVTISGDANLAEDGKLRLKNLDEITERALAKAGDYFNRNEEALKRSDLKKGKTLVGGATTPIEVPVGTGANAIPQRDSSGNLKAETADQATNADAAPYSGLTGTVPTWDQDTTGNATTATSATDADKLDGQEGSHYLDMDNHTGSTSTSGSATTTKKTYEVIEYTTSNYPISFTHTMPYIPDVSVYMSSGSAYTEIDAQVDATAAASGQDGTITIGVSEVGMNLKVIAK